MPKKIISSFIILAVFLLSSCSTVHKPAKVIPGYNLGITGTAIFAGQGNIYKDSVLDSRYGTTVIPNGQLEFGYGFKESRFYTGVKIPAAFFLANVDLYYQWLDYNEWSCGTGVELGYLMGVYGILGYTVAKDMELGIGNRFAFGLADNLSLPDSNLAERPIIYDVWLQYWYTFNNWFKFGIDAGMSFHRSNQSYSRSYSIIGFNPGTFHTSLSARFNF